MPKPTFESVVAGPFSIQFCNRNLEMKLRGHCHFAQVYFEFETLGSAGFPSFEHTHAEIALLLRVLTARPFRDATNEEVLRRIFTAISSSDLKEPKIYDCHFSLFAAELHVRGVPDDIGHADSFTVYKIRRNDVHH